MYGRVVNILLVSHNVLSCVICCCCSLLSTFEILYYNVQYKNCNVYFDFTKRFISGHSMDDYDLLVVYMSLHRVTLIVIYQYTHYTLI